ncbi:MAG: hypothetical protein AAF533_16545 [Acidobacteriota bacterium]
MLLAVFGLTVVELGWSLALAMMAGIGCVGIVAWCHGELVRHARH